MESLSALPLVVVLVAVLVAAGTDLWKFRLHNWLTIPLFFTGLLYHATADGTSDFALSVLGTVVAAAPLLIPYCAGGMGAGDLKLMAGVGAWLGPWAALHVLIVSGLATGCWSAVLMVGDRTRCGREIPLSVADPSNLIVRPGGKLTVALSRSDRRSKAVPFGVLVALGVIVTAIWIGG
jgi:prepilin peptidase CpaA